MSTVEPVGKMELCNIRREVPVKSSGRRRKGPQITNLNGDGISAFMPKLAFTLGHVGDEGVTLRTMWKVCMLFKKDVTKQDCSAGLSRLLHMEGAQVLRWEPKGRNKLRAIGLTGESLPNILRSHYQPGTRTAKRKKISKKVQVVVSRAP